MTMTALICYFLFAKLHFSLYTITKLLTLYLTYTLHTTSNQLRMLMLMLIMDIDFSVRKIQCTHISIYVNRVIYRSWWSWSYSYFIRFMFYVLYAKTSKIRCKIIVIVSLSIILNISGIRAVRCKMYNEIRKH